MVVSGARVVGGRVGGGVGSSVVVITGGGPYSAAGVVVSAGGGPYSSCCASMIGGSCGGPYSSRSMIGSSYLISGSGRKSGATGAGTNSSGVGGIQKPPATLSSRMRTGGILSRT